MRETISGQSENLLSSVEAGRRFGYTNDYVARLARHGKVRALRIGRGWFVDQDSLGQFVKQAEASKQQLAARIREERKLELTITEEARRVPVLSRLPLRPRRTVLIETGALMAMGALVGALLFVTTPAPEKEPSAVLAHGASLFERCVDDLYEEDTHNEPCVPTTTIVLDAAVGNLLSRITFGISIAARELWCDAKSWFMDDACMEAPQLATEEPVQGEPPVVAVPPAPTPTLQTITTPIEIIREYHEIVREREIVREDDDDENEVRVVRYEGQVEQIYDDLGKSLDGLRDDVAADFSAIGESFDTDLLTVSGDTTLGGALAVAGATTFSSTLQVLGDTTLTTLTVNQSTTTNATTTTLYALSARGGDLAFTNATSTNLFASNLTATNGTVTTLAAQTASGLSLSYANAALGTAVISAANITQASSTNFFTNRFVATAATTTDLFTTRLAVDSFALGSGISSHFVPAANDTYDLGSPSFFWRGAYIDTLTANSISAASTSIGGTNSETLTLNADNATLDTEDMSLIFYRGSVVPNAVLTWDSTEDRFEFNQPAYLENQSGSSTQATLTLQGLAGQVGNLFQVASSSGETVFSVASNGAVSISTTTITAALTAGTSTLTNLAVSNLSTSTFAGGLAVGTSQLVIQQATGNVGIGTAAPGATLDLNAGGDSHVVIGQLIGEEAHTILSFNGVRTNGANLGIGGGGSGDPNLYLAAPTGGSFQFEPNGEVNANIVIGMIGAANALSLNGNMSSGSELGLVGGESGDDNLYLETPAGGAVVSNSQVRIAGGSYDSLLVTTSDSVAAGITLQNSDTGGQEYSIISTGTGSDLGAGHFAIRHGNSDTFPFVITPGGNVGVGTSSAWAKLSVSQIAGGGTIPLFTVASSTGGLGTTTAFHIAANGQIGINTASPGSAFVNLNLPSGVTQGYNVSTNQNAEALVFRGDNTNSGSSARLTLQFNNNNHNSYFTMNGSGTATSTYAKPDGLYVRNTGPGIDLAATRSDGAINFWTGGSNQRMTINASGFVGIGTTTPNHFLDVWGNSNQFQVGRAGVGAWGTRITSNASGPNVNGEFQWAPMGSQGSSLSAFAITNSSSATQHAFFTNGNAYHTGSLAVGTTSPQAMLHIGNGATVSNWVFPVQQTPDVLVSTTSSAASIGIMADAGATGLRIGMFADATNDIVGFGTNWNGGSGRLDIKNGSTNPSITITASGFVGINDTSADYRLETTGSSGSGYFGVTNSTDGDIFAINSSGFIGIGTADPVDFLEVRSSAGTGASMTLSGTVDGLDYGYSQTSLRLFNPIYSSTPEEIFAFGAEGNLDSVGAITNQLFYIFDTQANDYRLVIDASGNVGIGTANPTSGKLQVADGNIALSGTGSSFLGTGPQALNVGHTGFFDLNLQTNGLTRQTITAAGNVGIGTTTPASLLDVTSSGASVLSLGRTNATHLNRWDAIISTDTGYDNGSLFFEPQYAEADFLFRDFGNTVTLALDNSTNSVYVPNGNVGIGTTTPDTKLLVQQSSTGRTWTPVAGNGDLIVERNGNAGIAIVGAASGVSYLNFGDTNDENAGFISYEHANDAMTFRTGGSGEDMRIDSSGNVGIGKTPTTAKLEIVNTVDGTAGTAGSLRIYDNLSGAINGLGTSAGSFDLRSVGNFSFFSGTTPTEFVRITNTGNVGIGTTTPDRPLHVNGGSVMSALGTGGTFKVSNSASSGGVLEMGIHTGTGALAIQGNTQDTNVARNLLLQPFGGNIGIGTTSPMASLSIYGGNATRGAINMGGTGSYNAMWLNGSATFNDYNFLSSAADKNLFINRPAGEAIFFRENNVTQMAITAGGTIGIGISTSNTALSVYSTAAGGALTGDIAISSFNPGLQFVDRTTSADDFRMFADGNKLHISTDTDDDGTFDDSLEFLTLTSTGNVGIGTTSPAANLEIAGTAYVSGASSTTTPQFSINPYGLISDNSALGFSAGRGKIGYDGTRGVFMSDGGSTKNIVFDTANVERMRVTTAGFVGIGTTNPDQGKVEVKGGTVCVDTNSDDNASSCIASESDERLKENITPLSASSSLAAVLALNPVSFDWRVDDPDVLAHYPLISRFADRPYSIGLIAQDVQFIVPEAIELETVGDEEVQYLQLDYAKLIPHLIGAIKELYARIASLGETVAGLLERDDAQEARITELETEVDQLRAHLGTGEENADDTEGGDSDSDQENANDEGNEGDAAPADPSEDAPSDPGAPAPSDPAADESTDGNPAGDTDAAAPDLAPAGEEPAALGEEGAEDADDDLPPADTPSETDGAPTEPASDPDADSGADVPAPAQAD
ncbi:MAG: hypothetical protein GEV13_00985 [Rhodospirillales bacterium]|nr:hypothetical protein [Rhodospirillales bacterium]